MRFRAPLEAIDPKRVARWILFLRLALFALESCAARIVQAILCSPNGLARGVLPLRSRSGLIEALL